MTYYHVTIATERRTDPERQAINVPATVTPAVMNGMDVVTPAVTVPQRHTMTDSNGIAKSEYVTDGVMDWSDPQFILVVSWDLVSPYVIVHKGDYHARTMTYAGWPELTAEEWINAQNPADEYL